MLAAFQWEGAASDDGKGASDWDMFAHRPGAIAHGDTLDVACDGYHRYEEDVALMREFGVQAHDLTVAWSRVLPEGVGTPNEQGLDFYDRLIDSLLAAGVEPWVTVYHHGLPLNLYRRGGWLNRDVAAWFADYAGLIVERLSDRVSRWLTFELPEEVITLGYELGIEAPGHKVSLPEVLQGAHNVLRSHGMAMQAIRAAAREPLTVGVSVGSTVWMPASDSDADIEAARAGMFSVREKGTDNNVWWMDPIVLGRYPDEGLELFGADAPSVHAGDMETIAQPLDFLGTGVYGGKRVRVSAETGMETIPGPPGMPRSSLGWGVTPDALYWGPRLLHDRYGLPLVITENGVASHDWVSLDGAVHDPLRIDFTCRYLLELERAIVDGADVRAYFHWTWIDNFECAEGFAARYGMIHCDFETLKRTPKDSAYWYRDVIRTNGASLHEDPGPVAAERSTADMAVGGA
jgi:beta-glucosidase